MKICTGPSSRFYASQIQRIEEGFVALGHELTPYPAESDLIFVNNPPFTEIIADKLAGRLRGKLIFDVQDIPHHIADFDLKGLAAQLYHADAVTAISEITARDLSVLLGVDAKVVYQPIMPVTRTRERKHSYRVMFVGRISDPNKRSLPAAIAIQSLGYPADQVVTVGGESPFFGGVYWGVATEAALNDLYNSVDFVVCTGKNEGLCLPMVEAMAAGAIPIVCRDLATREEFLPAATFPEYLDVESTPQSIARFVARFLQDNGAMEEMKARLHAHYSVRWEEATSGVGVARCILEVYQSL